MSGEYYILEELSDPSDTDNAVKVVKNNNQGKDLLSSHKGSKLLDIEHQLKLAESRCSCLKSQLDYMKELYGVRKGDQKSSNASKISVLKKHYETLSTDISKNNSMRTSDDLRTSRTTQTNLFEVVETDTTTHVQGLSNKSLNMRSKPNKAIINRSIVLPDHKISLLRGKKHEKLVVTLPKTPVDKTSASPIKKASRRNMKGHTIIKTSNMGKRKAISVSQDCVIQPDVPEIVNTKLVEIYHNAALKASDSDDSNTCKKGPKQNKDTTTRLTPKDIPPLKINQDEQPVHKSYRTTCEVGQVYQKDKNAVTAGVCNVYSKNYALPTIASRMKQVAKNYLSTYNFKAIPFCIALSTTPSHNIGINIQQVMNIIKTHQPLQGLSPTLTHNIVLAASKLNYTPLGSIMSSINSKIERTGNKQECPLSKSMVNYRQLEEMAKTIPDDVVNEGDESPVEQESPVECTTIIGPTGEFKIRKPQTVLWTADTNNNSTCTCAKQSGLDLHQVASKYQSNQHPYTASQASACSKSTLKRFSARIPRTEGTWSRSRPTNNVNPLPGVSEVPKTTNEPGSLQGKEQNLKEVLTNLHNDFEELNKRYEEFTEQINAEGGSNPVYAAQLEKLEQELNNKEEEITMVMALYKEVIALKQQVKILKKHSSKTCINMVDKNTGKFREYNNPRAAFHLTKLLRQIQHYQLQFKNKA